MTFSIDDPDTVKGIAKTFGVPEKQVKRMRDIFKDLFLINGPKSFRAQYLSHLVRAMEIVIREEYAKDGLKNPFFQISIEPVSSDDPETDLVCAKPFKKDDSEGARHPIQRFVIYYHPNLHEKQLRVGVAHELGHLYLCTLSRKDTDKSFTEPLSSIFGSLAILQKTYFYNENLKTFNPRTPQEVLDLFRLMANRKQGNFNTSS